MNNDQQILLHLSLIKGIGALTIQTMIQAHTAHGPLRDIYNYSQYDLIKRCGISATQAALVAEGLADSVLINNEYDLLEKHGFSLLTLSDQAYPMALRHIIGPPPVLYQRGASLQENLQGIAFVGSRKATWYAKDFINSCVPPLVQQQLAIISGGAYGADSMAHEAALAHSGITIAVLGSGLLCPYPAQNKKLFDRIVAEGGTIISSFPLMTQPLPGNFPARNRIIAGLSRGCVVVQAARKSGALITAHYALENGRDIFAVPGSLHDPLSVGCNALIAQGARLVTGAEDILSDWNLKKDRSNHEPAAVEKKDTSIEDKLIALCETPCSLDELIDTLSLPIEQLHQLLFELQIAGMIMQNAAGLWERQ